LLANAVRQNRKCRLTKTVRQQAGSLVLCSLKIMLAAEIHCRSRLAGERGGSEPEVSIDENGSPASRLLGAVFAEDHARCRNPL